jgi:redox-sensing transcriptional repressor
MSEMIRREGVEIGIITVPAEVAQNVYDTLVDAGINAVLNFAPVQIRLREGVKIKSVDLRISLESLSFHLKQVEDDEAHR